MGQSALSVLTDRWQCWDLDGLRSADARQIIPQKIHDHNVLGTVLFGCKEDFGTALVFATVTGTGDCALDGAGFDLPSVKF